MVPSFPGKLGPVASIVTGASKVYASLHFCALMRGYLGRSDNLDPFLRCKAVCALHMSAFFSKQKEEGCRAEGIRIVRRFEVTLFTVFRPGAAWSGKVGALG